MIPSNRIIVIPALLGLLATGLSSFAQSQTPASPEASRKTVTISGSVGRAGVIMAGLPQSVITDPDGRYSATVEYGWSGIVMPEKEGYSFDPPSRGYDALSRDATSQDYKATVIVFSISGSVGAPGVVMRGLPGDPMTGPDGSYRVQLPYGWAGAVTPSKQGYEFEPRVREYSRVKENRRDEDYVAREIMLTISDTMTMGDEPIPGVRVTAEPGGYSAVTDDNGKYSIQVPHGWSGKLTLSKEGFQFEPSEITYNSVTSDIIDGKPVPASGQSTRYGRGMARRLPRVAGPESGGNVLIIPTRAVAPDQFAQIAEDMRVMLNILREKLSEPRSIRGVLPDYGDFFAGGTGAVEAVYLQGYAAIFMLKADFPLSPTPQGQAEPQQTEPADPVWQRARDRLYAPQSPTAYGAPRLPGQADQRSFDQLKEELIRSLKHAANIRNMDPNDQVILTVTGRSEASSPGMSGGYAGGGAGGWVEGGGYGGGGFGGSGGFSGTGSYNFGGSGGGSFQVDSRPQPGRVSGGRYSPAPAAPGSATVLTIQAKKGDIDAFAKGSNLSFEQIYGAQPGSQGQDLAKGSLSFEQFQQRVQIFTY